MATGRISVSRFEMKSETTNSLTETTTAKSSAAKSPGRRRGRVTRRKVRHGVAPRLAAARSRVASRLRALTHTERTTKGRTRATWAATSTARLRIIPREAARMRKPRPAATPGTTRGDRRRVAQSVGGRRADGQGQGHRPQSDPDAVDGSPLELRIGQRIDVPPPRKARRREGENGRGIERHHDDDNRGQTHEGHEADHRGLEHHAARAPARPIPARRAMVMASARRAKAAAPGQLNESSPRSFTTVAIIWTLPPPSRAGVGYAESVHAKTMRLPETMPGRDRGNVTRQ